MATWATPDEPAIAEDIGNENAVDTPIEQAATPEMQCGRFVHTGIHIAVAAGDDVAPFDNGCTDALLTAQEKAMEFLMFDLSSCVMKNDVPPMLPDVVR